MGELHFGFLAVREAGDALALHQRLPFVSHVAKYARRMTDQGDRFARVIEGLDQSDRGGALSEIPHRSMAADIEHRVKVLRLHIGEFDGLREFLLCFLVLFESQLRGSLIRRHIALWIERRLPSLWRGQRQVHTRVPEHKVRGRELLQPESRLQAGTTKNVVGRQNNQNFHVPTPLFISATLVATPESRLDRQRKGRALVRWYRRGRYQSSIDHPDTRFRGGFSGHCLRAL